MPTTAPPSPEGFRWSTRLEVRFRDLDALGHVNNAVYLTYFELARQGYMAALGHAEPAAPLATLFPFVVAEIRCRYLAPVGLGEQLRVFLRTSDIGTKSFEFEYLVVSETRSRTVASGSSTQVYYDYAVGQSAPVPPRLRQLVERLEGRTLGRRDR